MARRDDLAGAYAWSLKFTSTEGGGAVLWSYAGCKYRVGLPQLVHLEQGTLLVPERVEDAISAAHVLFDISRMLRGA